jgi:hypothetical protein
VTAAEIAPLLHDGHVRDNAAVALGHPVRSEWRVAEGSGNTTPYCGPVYFEALSFQGLSNCERYDAIDVARRGVSERVRSRQRGRPFFNAKIAETST